MPPDGITKMIVFEFGLLSAVKNMAILARQADEICRVGVCFAFWTGRLFGHWKFSKKILVAPLT